MMTRRMIYPLASNKLASSVLQILYSLAGGWGGDHDDLVQDCALRLLQYTDTLSTDTNLGVLRVEARRSFSATRSRDLRDSRYRLIDTYMQQGQEGAPSVLLGLLRSIKPEGEVEAAILKLCFDIEPYWIWASGYFEQIRDPTVTGLAKYIGCDRRRVTHAIAALRSKCDEASKMGRSERSSPSLTKAAKRDRLVCGSSCSGNNVQQRELATLGGHGQEEGKATQNNSAGSIKPKVAEVVSRPNRRQRTMGIDNEMTTELFSSSDPDELKKDAFALMRAGVKFFGEEQSPFTFPRNLPNEWKDRAYGFIEGIVKADWHSQDPSKAPDVILQLAMEAGVIKAPDDEDGDLGLEEEFDLDSADPEGDGLNSATDDDLGLEDTGDDDEPTDDELEEELARMERELSVDAIDPPSVTTDKAAELADRSPILADGESSLATLANSDAAVRTMMGILDSGDAVIIKRISIEALAELTGITSPAPLSVDTSPPATTPPATTQPSGAQARPEKPSTPDTGGGALDDDQQAQLDAFMEKKAELIRVAVLGKKGKYKSEQSRIDFVTEKGLGDPDALSQKAMGYAIRKYLTERALRAATKKLKAGEPLPT